MAQEGWREVAPPGAGFSLMVPDHLQPFGLSSASAPRLVLRNRGTTVRLTLFWGPMVPGGLAQGLRQAMAEDQAAGFAPIPAVQTEALAAWTSQSAGWRRAGRIIPVCAGRGLAGFTLEYGASEAVAGAALADRLAGGLRETMC